MSRHARSSRLLLLCAALLGTYASPAVAQPDRVVLVSWNVESGDANPANLAARIRQFQGVDIWALSEVEGDAWLNLFEPAAEDGENADFRRVLGTTGQSDRLAILFNSRRFELVRSFELSNINIGGSFRAPLVAQLRGRETGNEFLLMVNHLARGNASVRHQQGGLLNAWARQQTLPVVAAGDYNFDWDVANGASNHDAGFDRMTADNVFVWVRPATLVRTQCSEGTGTSGGSVLDFVFAAQGARMWLGQSSIEVVAGDCPDPGPQQTDHRPVRGEFRMRSGPPSPVPPPPAGAQPSRQELLRRIEALEQQLRELRALVERLPGE
jgi:endonuclease/exonuclease/phosphatase family metal-dependent hydrolase